MEQHETKPRSRILALVSPDKVCPLTGLGCEALKISQNLWLGQLRKKVRQANEWSQSP